MTSECCNNSLYRGEAQVVQYGCISFSFWSCPWTYSQTQFVDNCSLQHKLHNLAIRVAELAGRIMRVGISVCNLLTIRSPLYSCLHEWSSVSQARVVVLHYQSTRTKLACTSYHVYMLSIMCLIYPGRCNFTYTHFGDITCLK